MSTYPGGVAITGYISPTSTLDTYATHKAKFGHGGYRSVLDIAERNQIDETRREIGMVAYVISEDKEYRLVGGITDNHWVYEPNSAYQIAVANGYGGTLAQWLTSLNGIDGKSAYELATANGYTGTITQWLNSLKGSDGKSAYEVAVANGYTGNVTQWLTSVTGIDGKSAYEVAVANGYTGNVTQWLNSLVGAPGIPGKSAYQVATANGYTGTEVQWLNSLKGVDGKSAFDEAAANGYTGTEAQWVTSLTGLQGPSGSSAYQLAVSYGYTGTEQDWVTKLNNTLSATALTELINTNSMSDTEVLNLVNSKIGNYLPLTGGKMTGAITAIKETRSVMSTNNLDLATANLFIKTLTGATTFTLSNKAVAGDVNSFILELTNGGAFTVTFWAGVKWAGGTIPALTAAGTDVLGFYSHDGGTTWRGILMAKDSK